MKTEETQPVGLFFMSGSPQMMGRRCLPFGCAPSRSQVAWYEMLGA